MQSKSLLLVALLLLVGVAALAAAPGAPAPKDFAVRGDPVAGEKLYVQTCASCHGKKGKGDGIAGKTLNPQPASFADGKRFKDVTDWELFVAVRDGGAAVQLSPQMPPWGTALTEQQIKDVLAYVKTSFIDPARKSPAK